MVEEDSFPFLISPSARSGSPRRPIQNPFTGHPSSVRFLVVNGGMDPYDSPLRSRIVVPITHSLLRTSLSCWFRNARRKDSLGLGDSEGFLTNKSRIVLAYVSGSTFEVGVCCFGAWDVGFCKRSLQNPKTRNPKPSDQEAPKQQIPEAPKPQSPEPGSC